jgi:hypothetical protein
MTGEDMKRLCKSATGLELRPAAFPWTLVRIGGLVVPLLREASEMAYLWKRPHRLDGSRLEMLLGGIPYTRPEIAVAAAIRDLRLADPADSSRPLTVSA